MFQNNRSQFKFNSGQQSEPEELNESHVVSFGFPDSTSETYQNDDLDEIMNPSDSYKQQDKILPRRQGRGTSVKKTLTVAQREQQQRLTSMREKEEKANRLRINKENKLKARKAAALHAQQLAKQKQRDKIKLAKEDLEQQHNFKIRQMKRDKEYEKKRRKNYEKYQITDIKNESDLLLAFHGWSNFFK